MLEEDLELEGVTTEERAVLLQAREIRQKYYEQQDERRAKAQYDAMVLQVKAALDALENHPILNHPIVGVLLRKMKEVAPEIAGTKNSSLS